MREIKFRCWSEERGMWYSDTLSVDDNECHLQIFRKGIKWGVYDSIMGNRLYSGEYHELMQYTGLKDKNGKEIYEGDILYCHEYDSSDTGGSILQTFTNAVVGFTSGSFYYYPKGNMNQPHQLLMYAYQPKVIGNIYENPELLKTNTNASTVNH